LGKNLTTLLVTVSDDRSGRKGGKYSETQDKVLALFQSRPEFGIDKYAFWKWSDIEATSFYQENKALLSQIDPHMNGRAYKSFVVQEGLKSLENGNVLIYNDVSPEMWDVYLAESRASWEWENYDINVIRRLCVRNNGILTAAASHNHDIQQHTHKNFTLDRCISMMGLWKYRDSIQHASGMIVLQKSDRTVKFAEEWLKWNLTDGCANEGPVGTTEYTYWHEEVPNKLGHRGDQSVSGLLLNQMNHKVVEPIRGYCFLGFCMKNTEYKFVETNHD
jgi:hypothetical protein